MLNAYLAEAPVADDIDFEILARKFEFAGTLLLLCLSLTFSSLYPFSLTNN